MIGYRLGCNSISDLKRFDLNFLGVGVSVFQGTHYVIFTSKGSNPRRVYDHTRTSPISVFDASHERTHDSGEAAVVSLSEHGVYVIMDDEAKVYSTVFADGEISEILVVTEFGVDLVAGLSRLSGTTTCIAGSLDGQMAIFDCLDSSGGTYSHFNIPQAPQVQSFYVSSEFRLILLISETTEKNEFYKIDSLNTCSNDLCLTCDNFTPEICLICKENSLLQGDNTCQCQTGYFLNNQDCIACDTSCGTCTDLGCITCKEEGMTKKEDGKCSCNEGYWNPQSLKCETCPFPCSNCNSYSKSDCTSCKATFYLENMECLDCSLAQGPTPLCPPPIEIEVVQKSITEKSRVIELKFDTELEEEINSEEIKGINFLEIFKAEYFSKIIKNYEPLNLTSFSYSQGKLNFSFAEYLLFSNTDEIKIDTIYPFNKFFNSSTNLNNLYFKNQTLSLGIEKVDGFENLSQEEKEQEQRKQEVEKIAETPGTVLSGTAAGITVAASFSGASMVFLIKFFQILEILSNFEKINTKLGDNLEIVLAFLSKLEPPEIKTLAKLSPIDDLEDSEGEYKDRDLFMKYSNGKRGKIIKKNRDVFLFYGQNFLISMLMISSWIFSILLSLCFEDDNWAIKFFTILYRTLLGFFYFDFQMICVAEISSRTILKKQPLYMRFSYFGSLLFVIMTLVDFIRAYKILGKKLKNETLRYDQKLILATYSDEFSEEAIKRGETYLILDNIRFFAIQIFIVTFQLLNHFQAAIIVAFNFIYFFFVVWKLMKKKIFSSKFTKYKFITSEICILIVLVDILIFSLIDKGGFKETLVYRMLETTSIICIIVAVIFELVYVIKSLVGLIMKFFQKEKSEEKSAKRKRRVFSKRKKYTWNFSQFKDRIAKRNQNEGKDDLPESPGLPRENSQERREVQGTKCQMEKTKLQQGKNKHIRRKRRFYRFGFKIGMSLKVKPRRINRKILFNKKGNDLTNH